MKITNAKHFGFARNFGFAAALLMLGACNTAGVSPVQSTASLPPIQNQSTQQQVEAASTTQAPVIDGEAGVQTASLPGVEDYQNQQAIYQNGTARSGVALKPAEANQGAQQTLELPNGSNMPNVAEMEVMNPNGEQKIIPQDATTQLGTTQLAYAETEIDPVETQAEQRIAQLYPRMQHSVCKGGWATQPEKLDAKREIAGHPYYIEMRLRHTPLLPVGHTYIAYGRLSPEGKPIDENVIMLSPIGGYGGAAVAAAVPMPGVLTPVKDDCAIKPIAAYRVTLNAQDFEKLLLRIKKLQAEKPAYALFAYNCNHFASDVAAAVGIKQPANKYVYALDYIYQVIEANEGFNPKKQRARRG